MRCAIGFVCHTGWAVAVAVGEGPRLLDRRRIELIGGGERFVYHASQELPLAIAERKVSAVRARSERAAIGAIAELVARLNEAGHTPRGCAVVGTPRPPQNELETILKSHALIHSAEGDLYRVAIAAGAAASSLTVTAVAARELDAGAAELQELGRGAGPPWGKDQKLAALAALRVLRPRPATSTARRRPSRAP